MYAQRLDGPSRRQATIMALIASIVAVLLFAIGCGESVAASQPAATGGDNSALLVP